VLEENGTCSSTGHSENAKV